MSDLINRQDAIMHFVKVSKNYECGMFNLAEVTHELCEIASAEPKQRWIPCSERLPIAYVEVLVCQLYGDVPFIAYIAYVDSKRRWCTEGFFISEDYEPIAWMPLPDAYEGDD